MPNWCSNVLTWDADDVTTAAIFAAVSKDLGDGKVCHFSYESILPQPPEVIESINKSTFEYLDAHPGESQDMFWYEWRAENWGCKWDNDYDVDKIDHGVAFSSPWAPPIPIMEHLAKKFPGVPFNLQYDESGCGFCGECDSYYELDGEVSVETNNYDLGDDPAGYMRFQKNEMCNENISYNGSIVNVEYVYTDTLGDYYLLSGNELSKESSEDFDADYCAIENCLSEEEFYKIDSVEWFDDHFTVTATPVDGIVCSNDSLRLEFPYESE